MSDTPPPPAPPPYEDGPRARRSGCMTAFMVVAGVVLLLPGLCAIIFGGLELTNSRADQTVTSLVVLGLLVGFVGVMLIVGAVRGSRS